MEKRLYEYIEITDLKDMLNKTKELYGSKIAYKIKKENGNYTNYTHKQVRDMIDCLGTALIDMGLKNKRIAVIGGNSCEWEIAYLSIVCGTGTVVPLDKSLPENELKSLIERSEVEAIFFEQKYEEILEKMKYAGVGKLKHLISMNILEHKDGIYSQKELIKVGKKMIENGDKRFVDAKINPEEMNIMLFTSGTTSASKVVALSHKNICSNLMDIASILDVNSDDVFLSVLPIHHVFECTVGFLFSLYKGAQTVFCDGLRHIIDNLNEYHVSIMACVPAIYERIFKIIRKNLDKEGKLKEILQNEEKYKNATMDEKKKVFKEIHDMLGGNIKLFISGAAALDKDIEQRYRNLGLNLVQGYGLTETSPVVGMGNKKFYKVGSIGKSMPSVEAKIVDAGGGGKGIRIVESEVELENSYNIVKQEAKISFNDDEIYIEKFIKNPRHVEIQILADECGNVIHLGERDCSIQRKHQKVIEETPSTAIDEKLRSKMGEAAIKVAKIAGYTSCGTVEFLVDQDKNFYFMEMNTRIQVEHPITEMRTGIDIVKEQIRIAAGEKMRLKQKEIVFKGNAIECRINAENPSKNFRPCPGKITGLHFPGGNGIRIDTAIYEGYTIPANYDSMIAKIIVLGNNRNEAIAKMKRSLEELVIEGVDTNRDFLFEIIRKPNFIRGDFDTSFISKNFKME